MKKIAVIILLSITAGIASADFAITWKSVVNPMWKDGGSIGGPYLDNGNLVQLIWVQDMPDAMVSKAGVGGTLAFGEILIGDATMISADYGFWDPGTTGTYDLTDGYVFSRVFDSSAVLFGEFYWDSAVIDVAANQLDVSNPQTVWTADIVGLGGVGISDNGTTVVPEPATLGLMGVAGLGMFLARRKSRR